jgi:hypothetical protein
MFPESDEVTGEDPNTYQTGATIGWKECNQYAINVAKRISISQETDGDFFYGFKIYYAPAYDNRLY